MGYGEIKPPELKGFKNHGRPQDELRRFDENTVVGYMIASVQEPKPEGILTDLKTCFSVEERLRAKKIW